MALDVLITGANLDASGNLKVALPQSEDTIGPVSIHTENDDGAVTGTKFYMEPETSPDYKLRVGTDTLLFNDSFNTTAQNTGLWKTVLASMTATEGSGSLLLNANSTSAASSGVAISSWRHFPLIQTTPTYVEFSGYPTVAPLANQIVEFGLFVPTTGIVAPVEGAFFRYSSAGLFGVINYNGVETQVDCLTPTLTPGSQASFTITIGENRVRFWRGGYGTGDQLIGTIEVPAANGTPFLSYALPLAMQFRNAALVSGSPQMQWKICNVSVGLADWATSKPWGHQMCGMGLNAAQGQNGHTSLISTAVAATAAPAAAAALVAASAAAQFTGLGGIFRVLPTLTANTEGLLCNYVNPVGGINATPRTLYITGVKLYSMVEVALTGGPLINVYQLLYGASADTLVTAADSASFASATVKCHRRIPLGIEVYQAAAALGAMANPAGLSLDLSANPIVINPGERVAIGLRNQGTVTTAGNLLITVAFTGYWE
jgi:hypothetical protein